MKITKSKVFLLSFAVIVLVIAGIVFYYYQQGSAEHYVPPVEKAVPSEAQAVADLTDLSKAVDAYYSLNLKYPGRLDELQPDFVLKIPVEPLTGKSYGYETDGSSRYRIITPNPGEYHLKILANENGKLIKQ
jgi:hypothetical protein